MRKLVAGAALALGVAGVLASLPSTAHAATAWTVGLHASKTTTQVGYKVVFTGVVRPRGAAAGGQVVLQEKFRPGVAWKSQRRAPIGADGSYRVVDKPTVNTVHAYRVVMPADARHARGVSRTVLVTAYAWETLGLHDPNNQQSMFLGSVDMNGVTYADSVFAFNTPSHLEFNLDHRCTRLSTTFGMSDDSTTGGQARVDVLSDGTTIYTHTFDLGQTDPQTLPLASPLKLRIESTSTSGVGTTGLGAAGSARVLCTR
jgi:hypothetical protein